MLQPARLRVRASATISAVRERACFFMHLILSIQEIFSLLIRRRIYPLCFKYKGKSTAGAGKSYDKALVKE